ncbi:hypothetical protein [Bradyrhizobium sp. McL0616]|uniref:hypothetical protein n=1 Tax=Bradyrhizobium sp. McL0616 TaxID=3415674 RepID=UPI003CEEAAC9
MTEDEAEEAFSRINSTLRENGLAWLADQIAGEAAEGRASTKILSVQEYAELALDGPVAKPKKRKTEFTHVRPLTSKEKLSVSITALRAILVSSGKILPAVSDTLGATNIATFSFASDADTSSTSLLAAQRPRISAAAIVLDERLQALMHEVDHDA